jgi:hypothetical protein
MEPKRMNQREKDALEATMKWFFQSSARPKPDKDDPNITLFNAMAVALIELNESRVYDKLGPPPTMEDAYNRGYKEGYAKGYGSGFSYGQSLGYKGEDV